MDKTIKEALEESMIEVDSTLNAQKTAALESIKASSDSGVYESEYTKEDSDRIAAVYKELQSALEKNESFVLKTDLTLRGVVELINMLRTLNDFYARQIKTLGDNKASIKEALIDIEYMNKRFESSVNLASTYIKEALNQMDSNNALSLELRDEMETLHDKVIEELLETKKNLELTKNTYEKLQTLERDIGNLDIAMSEASKLTAKNEQILQDMQTFVSAEITKAQGALFLKKEEFERDMQNTRDVFLKAFNDMLVEIKTNADAFKVESDTIKNDTIETLNTLSNKINTTIKTMDEEVTTRLNALKESSVVTIQSSYNNLLASLNTQVDMMRIELQTTADLIANQMKEHQKKHVKELEDLKNLNETQLSTLLQNSLDSLTNKTQESVKRLESMIAEQNRIMNENLDDFKNQKQAALDEVDSAKEQVIADMNKAVEKANVSINETKSAAEEKITEKLSNLEENKDAALQAFDSKKTANLEAISSAQEAALESIENLAKSKHAHFDEAIAAQNAVIEEKWLEFKAIKDETLEQMDTSKSEGLASFESKKTQILEAFEASANDTIREFESKTIENLNIFHNAIAIAHDSFQKNTFTSNGTWTRPDGVRNVYVSIRGGKGGDNSNNAGGVSSFGEYISALGGVGNVGGNGQYGEYKFALITLKEVASVNVVVASGGEVVVYYL